MNTCSSRKWTTEDENGNVLEVEEVTPIKTKEYRIHSVHNDTVVVVFAHVPKSYPIDTMADARSLHHFILDNLPAQTVAYLRELLCQN